MRICFRPATYKAYIGVIYCLCLCLFQGTIFAEVEVHDPLRKRSEAGTTVPAKDAATRADLEKQLRQDFPLINFTAADQALILETYIWLLNSAADEPAASRLAVKGWFES